MPRFRSVRVRAALAAALASVLCFGAGALWLRHLLFTERMEAELSRAQSDLSSVSAALRSGGVGDRVFAGVPFAAVRDTGELVFAGGELSSYWSPAGLRLPPDPPQDRCNDGSFTTRLGAAPAHLDSPLDHREVGMICAVAGRTTVYVLVSPLDAEQAVAAADRVLMPAVPLATLLVALVAWQATGRALRPVERIRAQLADITAQDLGRRVSQPGTGDELDRLAVTTNETLDRLEQAIERQRRFVADAAHELRSPLAGLRTTAEVALAHPAGADLRGLVAGTERLQRLTDDLLLLARLTGAETVSAAVDVAALAEEQAAERRVSVRTDGPALVTGSEGELSRLLRNLLDNALRHARSTVEVAVTTTDVTVEVRVSDDGPGVPVADRERIFDRFTRLDEARDRDRGGAGLGLAICRDIAVRHGGRIFVAGRAAFVCEFPARSAHRGGQAVAGGVER